MSTYLNTRLENNDLDFKDLKNLTMHCYFEEINILQYYCRFFCLCSRRYNK
jgi:hypothetical protein